MSAPVLQSPGPGNEDELLTTSLLNMLPGIRDNVFKANPVLNWLYQGKNKIRKRGGAALSHGLLYGTNSTAQAYQRFDVLDVTPQDGMTRDQWEWRQYAATISIDGFLERVANAGEWKLEDVMEEKKYQAEQALNTLLEQDIFAASPATKSMRSLATIIAASGTEGGINGTTNTWWASTVTASGSFSARGRADLTTLVNTLSQQNPVGLPEMLVSDQTPYEAYEGSLVSQERFTDNKMVDIGIMNLKFKNIPWTWSIQGTPGVIYAVHSDALEFIVNSDTDFITSGFVTPANQDARTAKILLACSLTTGNRRKLGKLTGVIA